MSSGAYSQNFDSLASAGTNIPWTNNVTLPGWYSTTVVYSSGTGSSLTGSFYSFGSAGSGERALGSLASGGTGDISFGIRLLNDTGFDRTNIVVSYTGEQWRAANSLAQSLQFFYRVGSSLTNVGRTIGVTWIPFSTLDFESPTTNGPQSLNGNIVGNRVAFTNVSLIEVVVPAGQELMLRWFDEDSAGFDHGLAIDDLTVSFGEAITNLPPVGTNASFSVATYNLKGNGASDWSTNAPQVQAIGRQLAYLNPDIIAFNEINNAGRFEMTNWSKAFLPDHTFVVSHGTDGFIRNGLASRFPIMRWTNYLDGASLTNFGYDGTFTRDLFEAQIAVPGFSQPLHVFVVHLKSGTDSSDDARRRGAEVSAITNFLFSYLATNAWHPYILAGDMNEDIEYPATGSQHPIQRLTNGIGLKLITPLNPFTLSPLTHSIQSTNGLNRRYDYILPSELVSANIRSSQVFRTDLLDPVPANLNTNDDIVASDHLPVLMLFNNPFIRPFSMTSILRSNETVALTWDAVPGQAYRVEVSPDLKIWAVLTDSLLATNYNLVVSTNLAAPAEFIRVKRVN